KIDAMRTKPARKFAAYGNARLDPGWDAIQSLDASAPVIGRLFLESDSTQGQSLEGRPLAMYSTLRLPDRSRLRLLNSRQRSAAAFGEQKRPDVRPPSPIGLGGQGVALGARGPWRRRCG
ncbi:MAG TPA: hypothetical protein VE201_00250, partial [Nitrospirales bacterium]|nr:hypothetical protein [Nitrospirales bacterium]